MNEVVFNCTICQVNVGDDERALSCDRCDEWTHCNCDTRITESIYTKALSDPSEVVFICNNCMVIGANLQSSSFVSAY